MSEINIRSFRIIISQTQMGSEYLPTTQEDHQANEIDSRHLNPGCAIDENLESANTCIHYK